MYVRLAFDPIVFATLTAARPIQSGGAEGVAGHQLIDETFDRSASQFLSWEVESTSVRRWQKDLSPSRSPPYSRLSTRHILTDVNGP